MILTPSVINTSLGTLQMLMNGKSCLIRLLQLEWPYFGIALKCSYIIMQPFILYHYADFFDVRRIFSDINYEKQAHDCEKLDQTGSTTKLI